ncbi:tetratricopeptide repeat protein [Streptomyces sp. H27-H5]|uniref:tetratricopeptide repeat protein n=1 Tax=Streptomyces sp. H27-H5 TaxID=2996460 RepID=UPI0022712BA3|nr:sel1 repeat family protein [Streptomyces sp. H27-H5]MCY0956042.1 sel1 repeat family protein [Streptomyces sp. H27-H5]
MSFLLLLVAAVLGILGWIGDNDSLSTAGWVVWLIGILLLLLRWWRNRRKFASVEHARAAAEAGDPRAMRALASIHKLGDDHAEAERLLRTAIELGDVEAMWDMGRLVDLRDGLPEAEPWFRMAAEHGHFFAKRMFRAGHAFNMDGKSPL